MKVNTDKLRYKIIIGIDENSFFQYAIENSVIDINEMVKYVKQAADFLIKKAEQIEEHENKFHQRLVNKDFNMKEWKNYKIDSIPMKFNACDYCKHKEDK